MDRWELYKSLEGKCARCGQKANPLSFVVDYAGRMICSACDGTIRLFMCDNFAPVLREPGKFYPNKEFQYPIMKVLKTSEHHHVARDFMMSHPEIERGTKLRKKSKLLNELANKII
jgi:hypothetical protein